MRAFSIMQSNYSEIFLSLKVSSYSSSSWHHQVTLSVIIAACGIISALIGTYSSLSKIVQNESHRDLHIWVFQRRYPAIWINMMTIRTCSLLSWNPSWQGSSVFSIDCIFIENWTESKVNVEISMTTLFVSIAD